jgi:hypothetical protein
MKPLIIKAGTTMPELHVLINEHVNLELNQSLTAVDIYVGDDHLRIACRVDAVDQLMEDTIKMIRIPGETVICHESIELDSRFVDYTQWPLVTNIRQLSYQLITKLGLVWMWECKGPKHYMKTTCVPLAEECALRYSKYGGTVKKYLTRL